jgi:hypothetical protein
LVHAVPTVQVPEVLQVSGWFEPEQLVWPGAHWPVHAPLMHVWLVQAAAVLQAPLAVHDWTPLPEHWVWPGAQTPAHAPLTQVWLVHAEPTVQVPAELHVWGWLEPEQPVCPGAHTPVHAPFKHVWLVHAVVVVLHVPLEVHVATPLPEQVV